MVRAKKIPSRCLFILAGLFSVMFIFNIVMYYVAPTINQNKWTNSRPRNYSITVSIGSVLGTHATYSETVRGENITRDDSYYSSSHSTIEETFNRIKACMLNPLAVVLCAAGYDPLFGYPIYFWENDLDLGNIVKVEKFSSH